MKIRRTRRRKQRGGESAGQHEFERAIKAGDLSQIQGVLEVYPDVDVNQPYYRGFGGYKTRPLYTLLQNKKYDIAKFLIEHGADIHIPPPVDSLIGEVALHYAILDLDMTRYLVERGAEINVRDFHGNTPLHTSVSTGAPVEVVQYLIDHGADVHIPDYYGATALHGNAARDVAEALIAAGADVNTISYADNHSMAPIHSAIQHGNRPLVEVLLKHGANVNLKYGPEQRTPLLMGLHGDNVVVPEFIQFLVEHGADPNITDRRGHNADWYIQQLNPELQVRFREAVAGGLRRRALRPIGRNLRSMYLGLGTNALPEYAMEKVMQSLTGIRTKNVARPNATGRIRNMGNVRETLKNLKRNYNR